MNDLFSIQGKVALVTGGGSGIGWMIAEAYARAGARVYIASRKKEELEARIAELGAGGEMHALVANLSTQAGCDALGDELEGLEEKLDILVNNAGANWGAAYEEFPESAWDRVLDLNLKGVFALTRRLTPMLARAGTHEDPARVINIGSIDGIQVPALETYSYSASKAAVHHMSCVLAKKLASQHITVNAVAPGPFQSRMMKATLERVGDAMTEMVPLRRIGREDDMAGVAIFLASRAGAFVTGTVIPVDGGISGTR